MKKLNFLLLSFVVLANSQISFGQGRSIVELPMKMRGLMPAVEATVNGKGPFLFAIDTGASGKARVDSSLVAELGLKVTGQVQAGDGSGQNVRPLDIVNLDSLRVGDLEFKDVEAATRNYNVPNMAKIAGILGFNLFADHILTLDFPSKVVRIAKGELPPPNEKDVLAFESRRGIAVIPISVGGQTVKAHLDSGNMIAEFVLPTAVVEMSKLASEPVVVGRAKTLTSDIEIKRAKLKETIRVGSFEFPEPFVSFPALSDANIGAAMMQDFSLAFDQKNKRVQFIRDKNAKKVIPAAMVSNPSEFVGNYGERTITVEGGTLFIQKSGGPKLKLVATAADEFTLEQIPTARIRFARDAIRNVTGIEVLNPAGQWDKAKRNVDGTKAPVATGFAEKAGIQFVLIPAGEFVMGSDRHTDDQKPARTVRLTKPFYLGIHEVTVGQFRKFIEATGYITDAEKQGWGNVWNGTEFSKAKANWREPGFAQTDDHPVVMVTYNDSVAFAKWAGGRLPTEAEWEYAARAGNSGELAGDLDKISWNRSNLSPNERTKPVGLKDPNAWGLFDMFGNVWERVSDWYDKTFYAKSANVDPAGPENGELKVNRGGGWYSSPRRDWASFRGWGGPENRDPVLGFRVAMNVEPKKM